MSRAALRIGVDARTFLHPYPRGEGKAGVRLYQELRARQPDWQIRLYGDRLGAPVPGELAGARVRVFDPPGHRWNTWNEWALPLAAWWDRIDVLHCTSSEQPARGKVPTVVTVHDVIPLLFDDGASAAQVARFRAGVEAAARRASAIIAVSESTRRDLIRLTGVDERRVHVVHWGTDSVPPAGSSGGDAAPVALGVVRPYLLAFGGPAPRKNIEGMIRGFARVVTQLPALDLVVVGLGRGPVRERCADLVVRLGLVGRVHLLPYLDDAMVERLYSGALALLYLSLYEGFGLPLLEAMSRGVPVVASNLSSMPEVLGDAGCLVDPYDELAWPETVAELLSTPGRMGEMRERGLARAEGFSWTRSAQQTMEILRAAADGADSRKTA